MEKIQSCLGNSLVIKDYTQGVSVCLSEVLLSPLTEKVPGKARGPDINYWKKHAIHILVPLLVSVLKKYNSLPNIWVSQYFSDLTFFFPPSWLIAYPVRALPTSQGTWITFFNYYSLLFLYFLSNTLDQHVIFTSQQRNEIFNSRFGLKCYFSLFSFLPLSVLLLQVSCWHTFWGHSEVWAPPVTSTTSQWTGMQGNCGTE